jgi:predicted restriction endonuclease
MSALRKATLLNYNNHCALCDIYDSQLLVASHIARWADNAEARGKLSNTICFCCFHDRLFEYGYFSLTDNLLVILKDRIESHSIKSWINCCSGNFTVPRHRPDILYLDEHRRRVGLAG